MNDGSTGEAAYEEPARSYVGMLYTVGFLVAGFILDVALGGAVAHLLGWLIAAAVILGVHALFVHAARATRSLSLTTAELRVGDEAIPRAEIVGVVTDPGPDLPVLGWPSGMPRGTKSVTIRLDDDQDVVVPTRHAARLQAALGAAGPRKDVEAPVRRAEAADLALLADIDERAETVFRVAGYDLPAIEFAVDEHAEAVFVVGDPPVGFAVVTQVDGVAHLDELAVVPKEMRKGYGGRLLERSCEWARDNGYPAITLTTYADVPWNGPYYAARGFVEVTDPTPGLVALRAREADLGLDDVGRRIVMRRDL